MRMNREVVAGGAVLVTTLPMPFCVASLLAWVAGTLLVGVGLGRRIVRGGEGR